MEFEEVVLEYNDISKVRRLNELKNPITFWDDVRKMTKNTKSDHGIKRWQILSEIRYEEILKDLKKEFEMYLNAIKSNGTNKKTFLSKIDKDFLDKSKEERDFVKDILSKNGISFDSENEELSLSLVTKKYMK